MRTYAFITHLAGWILFLSLPTLFVANQSGGSDFWSILFSWKTLLFATTYVSIFYLNTYLLIPYLYAKRRWWLYALSLLILLTGVWALRPYDRLISKRQMTTTENADRPPPRDGFQHPDGPFKDPDGRERDHPGPAT